MRVRASYRMQTPALDRLVRMPALFQSFANRATAVIAQDVATRFATSTAPDGRAWAPLSPSTLRKAVQDAKRKVGGRAAQPVVTQTRGGTTIVRARRPQAGFQRTARVRRTARSQILVDTGRLKASLVSMAGRGDAIRITDARRLRLVWGTRVPYARDHQYGTSRIPARPFLPLSRAALTRLRQLLQQEVRRP